MDILLIIGLISALIYSITKIFSIGFKIEDGISKKANYIKLTLAIILEILMVIHLVPYLDVIIIKLGL